MDLVLIGICIFSVLNTLVHAIEEVDGDGGPLWDNFGNIVGVRLPLFLGLSIFTLGLAGSLWLCAILAMSSPIALSILFGARVGDTLISHWGLRALNLSNPNPGIYSTVLYVAEAFAIYVFCGHTLLPWYAVLGAAFFAAVLPSLWLTGRLVPAWRK